MLTEAEIVYLLNNKQINTKCNNYIFTNLSLPQENRIITSINSNCILQFSKRIIDDLNNNKATNIIIDLNKIKQKNIFNYSLNENNIQEIKDFNNKLDILSFENILRKHNIIMQFIIHNIDNISIETQMLTNEMLWYNSYYFNTNILLNNNDLITYQLSKGKVLDNRENYIKIRVK